MFNKKLTRIPNNGHSFMVGDFWSDGCVVVKSAALRPVADRPREMLRFGPATSVEPVGYAQRKWRIDRLFVFSDGTVIDGRYLIPFTQTWCELTFETVEFAGEPVKQRPVRVLSNGITVGYIMPIRRTNSNRAEYDAILTTIL